MLEYLLEKARQRAEVAIEKKQTKIYITEVNCYQEIEKILLYAQDRKEVETFKYSERGYFIVKYCKKDSSQN